MTQLLGSQGDLNLNLMGGFYTVAACSDKWRQSICAYLSNHDDRLSKLEQTLSTMKSSIVTMQATNSGMLAEQRRINSALDHQKRTIS